MSGEAPRPKTLIEYNEKIRDQEARLLRASLKIAHLEKELERAQRSGNNDLDRTNRDLVAELMENNTKLQARNQELENDLKAKEAAPVETIPEKVVTKRDMSCQTRLNIECINELFEANLTLQRLQREQEHQRQRYRDYQIKQLQQQQQQQNNLNQMPGQEQQHQQRQSHQVQQQQYQKPKPVVSQLNYPHVTPTTTKHMMVDEKEILGKLFRLDGNMTTIRDKLSSIQSI